MTKRWHRVAEVAWRWPLLVALSIAAVVLINMGFERLDEWRDVIARDFDFNWWRFLLAGTILSTGGLVAGMAILDRWPIRLFAWRRTVAFGAVPLFLAMTLPMFAWGWPLTRMGSPLWEFRAHFTDGPHIGAAWTLVGLAVAGGLGSGARR